MRLKALTQIVCYIFNFSKFKLSFSFWAGSEGRKMILQWCHNIVDDRTISVFEQLTLVRFPSLHWAQLAEYQTHRMQKNELAFAVLYINLYT